MAHRLLGSNELQESEILLAASSQEPTMPMEFVLDQVKTKTWRTLTGWTIIAGFNDKINWMRGASGPFTITITAGTYATGAALAAVIETLMEAADVAQPFYTVSYSGTTHKFTIAHASLNISLLWHSGADTATCAARDLGFSDGSDTTSAVSHTATSTSYQSRHFLIIHRSDGAKITAAAVALVAHNIYSDPNMTFAATAPIKLQANATDVWTAPIFEESLTLLDGGDVLDPCVAYLTGLTTPSYEYWRLLIDAGQNTDGYFEVGVLYLGSYIQPTSKIQSVSLVNEPEDFSDLVTAIDGTHYVDKRRARNRWGIEWKAAGPADQVLLDDFFEALASGQDFFLHLISSDVASVKYGYFPERPRKTYVSTLVVTYTFTFCEAL